jgi:uncharacterized membrane protein
MANAANVFKKQFRIVVNKDVGLGRAINLENKSAILVAVRLNTRLQP